MAILKFRVYLEEDEAVYRDILVKHSQSFSDLHLAILSAYGFDTKHQATFYRTNDSYEKGREISCERYDKHYAVEPLLMKDTRIGSEIFHTNQKFIYLYDFNKKWVFYVWLILLNKEENPKIVYPFISRKEGIGPQQYGTKSLLGERYAEIEEKYDIKETLSLDGYSQESGENGTEGLETENTEEIDL